MVESAGEFTFIDWIRKRTPKRGGVRVGPGDDAAVVAWTAENCVVSTDMLLEGSCFTLETAPERIGRKALAVNLSDMAAMAAKPVAALVSLGLPRSHGQALAQRIFGGIESLAAQFDVAIVGGDTNSWNGPLAISVTILGEPTGTGPVLRNGAKPGDRLFVTGPLGGSILGHHLDFVPKVREAIGLHAAVELHAMIDISDGLARDLHHICDESGVGAVLLADRIPITEAARAIDNSLHHALGDGEDFELLFAVSPADAACLPADITAIEIGECVSSGVWLEHHGKRRKLPPLGYVHELD